MATPRTILFVDPSMLVEGHGFRPVFVKEGEAGFHQNGDWPYQGKPGQKMPWFFGPTFEDAKKAVKQFNERLGVSEVKALTIVAQSMAGKRGRGTRRHHP